MSLIWGLVKSVLVTITFLLVLAFAYSLASVHEVYGVKKELYSCSFSNSAEGKVNFSPFIYPADCNFLKARGHRDFSVAIDLLAKDTLPFGHYNTSADTRLYFLYPWKSVKGEYVFLPDAVNIDRKSIHLDYIDSAGKTIRSLGEETSSFDGGLLYRQTYRAEDFPRPAKVHISFDALLNKQPLHVDKTLQVEKTLEHKGWEDFVGFFNAGYLLVLQKLSGGN